MALVILEETGEISTGVGVTKILILEDPQICLEFQCKIIQSAIFKFHPREDKKNEEAR